MSFAASAAGALILWRVAPELANQRSRAKESTKPWDVVILGLHFLLTLLVVPAVAGLDAGRFHWSTLGATFVIPGVVLYAPSSTVVYWAMASIPTSKARPESRRIGANG